ncbi:hypothetical protein PIB30_002424 [Stylosanthes scabra]|uniref:Uncharacterized protein n=1 Tax=Stylosanthes scabra TaxID=79078 RepID=A0ABU6W1G0_9FABA|nr:hypothetical protein [Stylosanthes scabra]
MGGWQRRDRAETLAAACRRQHRICTEYRCRRETMPPAAAALAVFRQRRRRKVALWQQPRLGGVGDLGSYYLLETVLKTSAAVAPTSSSVEAPRAMASKAFSAQPETVEATSHLALFSEIIPVRVDGGGFRSEKNRHRRWEELVDSGGRSHSLQIPMASVSSSSPATRFGRGSGAPISHQ